MVELAKQNAQAIGAVGRELELEAGIGQAEIVGQHLDDQGVVLALGQARYRDRADRAGALDRLEGFASHFGADFYQLSRNTETVTLERSDWQLPEELSLGGEPLVPLAAGETLPWRMVERRPREAP